MSGTTIIAQISMSLSGPSNIDKAKVLKTDGICSLMQVESIAECSWSILQYFWLALSDNRSWKQIIVFLVVA